MTPGLRAQVACLLEVTARKPGNVHRTADFEGDAHFLDFLLSAAAIAAPLDRAAKAGVGPTVFEAVEATRRAVGSNTNLGMILLLTPLACVPADVPLGSGVAAVLDATTVDDSKAVCAAIQLARPGGLGSVPEGDVAQEPTLALRDLMALAAERDAIARQYATGFEDVFHLTLPSLRASIGAGAGVEAAIVSAFVATLAAIPDTLIARKRGQAVANEASRLAALAIASGHLAPLDAWLRADGHARNPGATADLVAAALFAALSDGTITLPIPGDRWGRLG